MGCRILHGLGLSFVWDHVIIWDLHGAGAPGGLWCLAGFGAGGVVNSTSDLLFTAPPAHEVGLALEFVGSFGVQIFLIFFNFFDVGGFLDGVVVLDHVGRGTACHSISLRHLLSFRISRIIFFQTNS